MKIRGSQTVRADGTGHRLKRRARRVRALVLAALATAAVAGPNATSAQELTRLYAPKPPAGSAYVRVVDLTRSGSPISFSSDARAVQPGSGEAASIYRIVKGGAPLTLNLAGKPVNGPVTPPADAFSTLVITPDESLILIPDSTEGRNDLKAQLRFYNLVPDCIGAVTVVDGPKVFEGVATHDTRQRSINPIEATLEASCGATKTEALKLPPLKAGDHYSLFLVPTGGAPVLAGQRDETEPYRAPAN
ncbi:alginate O-acetyltransferase AlgF [Xanthobacter sp. ZOL 2024]